MKTSRPLVFFGTETYSLPTLQALHKAGLPIGLVITKPDATIGRNKQLYEPPVKKYAMSHNINVLQPARVSEVIPMIQKLQPDIGVLVAYGKIIPQAVLDLFPFGIVNVHPSLLPTYRGPSPIETAILNGDHETGVSLIKLTAEMDAGPILAQKSISLHGNETKKELYDKLFVLGTELLLKQLPLIISRQAIETPQDDARATYTHLITKDDGIIDWQQPASTIERSIRAYAGWPKSRAALFGHPVIITKARITHDKQAGDLIVACGNNTWLEVQELIAPSGRTISGHSFMLGYKS